MKIKDIETIPLYNKRGGTDRADGTQTALIIKVHTDAGITGIGEVDSAPLICQQVIEAPNTNYMCSGLKKLILGEDPFATEMLWQKMFERSYFYGRKGAAINAISGIDMALWDIKGKALNKPLYELLGGANKKWVKAYASTLFPDDPGDVDYIKKVANYVKSKGYKAVKFGWGGFGKDKEKDYKLLQGARSQLGEEIKIMIDIGMKWDYITALNRAKMYRDLDLYWIEEPVPAHDYDGYRKISEGTPCTRIVGGEEEYCSHGFKHLIDEGKVDAVQPDISRSGGFTDILKVRALAECRGIPVIPHAWSTEILVAASIHFIAATTNAPWLEYCIYGDSPLRWNLVKNPLEIKDGYVRVPEDPGLGVKLDEDILSEYQL